MTSVFLQSLKSQWQDFPDVDLATADNSGNKVLDVSSIIVANSVNVHAGTSLVLRVAYDLATSVTIVSPVVQVLGVDSLDQAMFLNNGSGDDEITLTCALAEDIQDGTYAYSCVTGDTTIDLVGSSKVSIAIKIAGVLSTGAELDPKLQYKIV